MLRACLAAILSVLFLSATANATLVTYTYSGGSVSIPDNNATGVNLDINVTDTFDLVQFQSISISGVHASVGDLVMTLTHVPSGTTIDLIRQPGKDTLAGGPGDNTNWTGFTFSNINALTNAARPRVIDDASQRNSTASVLNGTYRPTTNTYNGNGSPTFTGETITDLNTVFDPISNISGIWRLNVQDLTTNDIGAMAGFSITLDTAVIPEPSSALMLGGVLALGCASWLRRRRQSAVEASVSATA